MKDIKVRLIKNKKELNQVHKIRNAVFIKEQKVSKEIEYDKHENSAKHIIAFYKNIPAGCARIRLLKGNKNLAKLERIAVLKKYRKKCIGKALLKYMISYSKRKKTKEIMMHAQHYALPFYKKCGFKPRGKIFYEADIKHIEMFIKPCY